MSIEKAKVHLAKYDLSDKMIILEESSATVDLAAEALNVSPDEIAKSLSFDQKGETVIVLLAGERRIDNKKYKKTFSAKAKMLSIDEIEERTGHEMGGVCPFGVNSDVKVYLDESLKDYKYVYPACGGYNTAIKLSIEELEKASEFIEWVDISSK